MRGSSEAGSDIERPLAAGQRMLWIGFGSILLLMVVIGLDVAGSLQRTTEKNASLVKSFRARDQVLDELRNITIRSGTMVRDYLAESDTAKAENERTDLEAARQQTEQLLDAYAGQEEQLDPRQWKSLADLKSGVSAYWESLAPVLRWDASTRRQKGPGYRQESLGPLRSEVLRLSRSITRLNEQQLDAGELSIRVEHTSLRTRLLVASTLGIGIGGLLAFFVGLRMRRLREIAEGQYHKVAHAREELSRLAGLLENAQEEERKRLSRELHDQVGQSMSAMLVELGRLESVLPQDDQVRARLASVKKQAEESVRSVRDMSLLLRPSMLDDLGLVAALKWQGREVARRTGLRVRVEAEDTGDQLADSVRTCLFRVVQEALNNCVKHARAASVRVVLHQSPGTIEVSVEDDGAGFDPATEKGVGLLGMEERVTRLHGSFHVQSTPGRGTMLAVRLPVPQMELNS